MMNKMGPGSSAPPAPCRLWPGDLRGTGHL